MLFGENFHLVVKNLFKLSKSVRIPLDCKKTKKTHLRKLINNSKRWHYAKNVRQLPHQIEGLVWTYTLLPRNRGKLDINRFLFKNAWDRIETYTDLVDEFACIQTSRGVMLVKSDRILSANYRQPTTSVAGFANMIIQRNSRNLAEHDLVQGQPAYNSLRYVAILWINNLAINVFILVPFLTIVSSDRRHRELETRTIWEAIL